METTGRTRRYRSHFRWDRPTGHWGHSRLDTHRDGDSGIQSIQAVPVRQTLKGRAGSSRIRSSH